jgi:hypothetical protein
LCGDTEEGEFVRKFQENKVKVSVEGFKAVDEREPYKVCSEYLLRILQELKRFKETFEETIKRFQGTIEWFRKLLCCFEETIV